MGERTGGGGRIRAIEIGRLGGRERETERERVKLKREREIICQFPVRVPPLPPLFRLQSCPPGSRVC